MTTNNTLNPFALLFPHSTPQQRLNKQLAAVNRAIEAEELRLIALQHKRAGILAQLDHLGIATEIDGTQYFPELHFSSINSK